MSCASPKDGGEVEHGQTLAKEGNSIDSVNSVSDDETIKVDSRQLKKMMIQEIDFLLSGASELTHPMRFEIDAHPPKLLATTPVSAEPMKHYWIFYDEKHNYVSHHELSTKIPADFRLPLDTLGPTCWGTPAYSLEGMSRDEVSNMIPNIIWDGPEKWKPITPYTVAKVTQTPATDVCTMICGITRWLDLMQDPPHLW